MTGVTTKGRTRHGAFSVGQILLGSVVGQGAVVAVSPLLTREYGPEDFGALTFVTSVSAVLGALATLGWERAGLAARSHALAHALAALATISMGVAAGLVSVVAFLWRHRLDRLFGVDVFTDLWWTVPAATLSLAMQRVVGMLPTRRREYRSIAWRNVSQGVVQAGTSVALGSVAGPLGLASGLIAGRLAGSVTALGRSRRGASAGRLPTRRALCVAARRYRRFPIIGVWSSVLNSLGLQLPLLVLAVGYGASAFGLVSLGLRVISTPVGLASDALAQFYEGALARRVRCRESGTAGMTLRLVLALVVVATVGVGVVIVGAPRVVPFLFGDDWIEAVPAMQAVAVMAGAQLVASPISRGLTVIERTSTQLMWDASRMALSAASVIVVTRSGGSIMVGLVALTAVSSTAYVGLIVITIAGLRRRDLALRSLGIAPNGHADR